MLRPVLLAALLANPNYTSSIEAWRAERETKLKAEDGWLSLAGLFWLNEGENRVGSAEGTRIQLPAGFPRQAGVLFRTGRSVRFRAFSDAGVQAGGKPIQEIEVRTDQTGQPDTLQIGRLRLSVIERGTKLGVRLKDPQSAARTGFTGLRWYPPRDDWNVRARFVAEPRNLQFDAQAGDKQDYVSPGYVEWKRNGRTLRLTPVTEGDQLFFVFRDATAGRTTYSAARFIYTDMPKDGFVNVDFNKAYNPPCVFTPYATCPLPPPENRLQIPVEAGEKMYGGY